VDFRNFQEPIVSMRPIHRFALLLPLLAACEGPLDPGDFDLDGTWAGRSYPFELSFQFEQDGDNHVTGTGTVTGLQEVLETVVVTPEPLVLDTLSIDTVVTGTTDFDVSGDWDYPDFELTLRREGYSDAQYHAAFVHPDSIRGTLQGSGFTNPAIVIVRQPDAS
jgi:hypothetical protein